MIPKLVHRIWFGRNPIPEQYESWWNGWKRQYPDYEFITWTDRNIPELTAVHQRISDADSMAKKSDIARYEILNRCGGVYLDCDIMPVNRYEFATETDRLIVCHERENESHNCQNAFIAVCRNHPVMQLAVETVCTIPAYRGDIILETGPGFFRRLLDTTTFKMLPTDAFYPYLFNQPFSSIFLKDLSKTYGIHVWGNSWLSLDMKSRKLTSTLHNGDITDTMALMAGLPCDNGAKIVIEDYMSRLRSARKSIIDFARSELAQGGLHRGSNTLFDLFKTSYFLLKRNPNAFIWHIGPGDGIANNKLRPILVNFDPPAVIIEPSFYAYHRLHRNYANNTRMSFVNALFGSTPGRENFFVINLDLADATGLDPRFHHLSSRHTDTRSILGQSCYDPVAKTAIMKCLERTAVETLNCEALLKMPGIMAPNIIAIDIDSDANDIMRDITNNGLYPEILYIDTVNKNEVNRDDIAITLGEKYEIVDFDGYMIAYHVSFYNDYCETLLSDYGIATIFQRAVDVITNPHGADGLLPTNINTVSGG